LHVFDRWPKIKRSFHFKISLVLLLYIFCSRKRKIKGFYWKTNNIFTSDHPLIVFSVLKIYVHQQFFAFRNFPRFLKIRNHKALQIMRIKIFTLFKNSKPQILTTIQYPTCLSVIRTICRLDRVVSLRLTCNRIRHF
jgi:hypothetical protein